MDNFQQYVRKEITGLVGQSRVVSQDKSAKMVVKKEPTPFVKSWSQNPIAWKSYNRSGRDKQCQAKIMQDKGANALLKGSKSDYLRHLLKAQQTLNAQSKAGKTSVSARKRSQTHTSNSTRRRLCLKSHMQIKRSKGLQTFALFSRQPSGGSQTYLKAKLQFQRNHPPLSLHLKMLSL